MMLLKDEHICSKCAAQILYSQKMLEEINLDFFEQNLRNFIRFNLKIL